MGKCVLANQVCPQTSDPASRRFCPAWWETMAQDDKGNQRLLRGCAWGQLPMYLNEFAQKAATAADAAQHGRNETAALGEALTTVLTLHTPLSIGHAQTPLRLPADQRGPADLAESPPVHPQYVPEDC